MTDRKSLAYSPTWWANPWWEDSSYQTEFGLPLEDIRASIAALRQIFDEDWTKRALEVGPPNVVLAVLFGGQGSWPFEDLMWLGRIASGCSQVEGVKRQAKELMGQKTWGTLLELEVASWFVEQDWKVELLKAAQDVPTPDIRIQKGGILTAIECKRFGAEQWEDWTADLSMALMRKMSAHEGPNSPSFEVLFAPRISDLVWDDSSIRIAVRDELVDRICIAIEEATHSEPPKSVDLPGICTVRMRPDYPGAQRGVGGVEISPQAKIRRILRNGVFDAARQLQGYRPGAVVVKSDLGLPAELVEVALNGVNRADGTKLSSVALVVIAASTGPPVIWRNPLLAEQPVSEVLTNAFKAIFASPSRRNVGGS